MYLSRLLLKLALTVPTARLPRRIVPISVLTTNAGGSVDMLDAIDCARAATALVLLCISGIAMLPTIAAAASVSS